VRAKGTEKKPAAQPRDQPQNARGGTSFVQIGKGETVSGEVLRQFAHLLRDGHLAPGARLPPERELATMIGISRPSVREALRALNLLGVVTTRHGSGTYLVASLDKLPLEPYLFHLLLNHTKLLELMQIRKIIEPEVAALAAKYASDDSRRAIQERFSAQEWQAAHSTDPSAEAQAEAEFHCTIAQAAGNQTIALLLESLDDLTTATGQFNIAQPPGASLEYHRRLMEAIIASDSRKARHAMRVHLADVERQLCRAVRTTPAGERPIGETYGPTRK
jgi:GntR family transcriptional repressor for pyruvate dehydrogenase complex